MSLPTRTPDRILVGLGLSGESEVGPRSALCDDDRTLVALAGWLGAKLGAEIRFVHAIESCDVEYSDDGTTLHSAIRVPIELQLQAQVDAAVAAGAQASFSIRVGAACEALAAEAEEFGAELLVVGPHREGYSFAERLFHGSTARELARGSSYPVWVSGGADQIEIERFMVLVELDERAAELLALADAFAAAFGAKPFALHCLSYPDDIALNRLPDAEERIDEYHQRVRQEAHDAIVSMLGDRADQWELLFSNDSIAGAAHEAVKAQNIDVTLVPSVALGGIAGRLLSTTAEKVLYTLHGAVLVVRDEPV